MVGANCLNALPLITTIRGEKPAVARSIWGRELTLSDAK
jgi:hypothetical protein